MQDIVTGRFPDLNHSNNQILMTAAPSIEWVEPVLNQYITDDMLQPFVDNTATYLNTTDQYLTPPLIGDPETARARLNRTITEPRTWRGQYGHRIEVQSMTIKHIKNCLKKRCITKNWRTEYIPKFQEEIRLRELLLQGN